MKSGEGISWGEYRWLHLIFVWPLSWIFSVYLGFIAKRTKGIDGLEGIRSLPKNAIVYGIHEDYATLFVYGSLVPEPGDIPIWIGYHGFFSYIAFCTTHRTRLPIVRYYFGLVKKPLEQIVDFLQREPQSKFGVGVDPARPDGRVRAALAQVAVRSHRPMVAMRCLPTQYVMIKGRRWPLPGTRIKILLGPIIQPETLSNLSKEAAREKLQAGLDEIVDSMMHR